MWSFISPRNAYKVKMYLCSPIGGHAPPYLNSPHPFKPNLTPDGKSSRL